MRILLSDDLDAIDLPIKAAVDAVRSAFEDAGRNGQLNVARHRVHTPSGVRVSVHQGAPVSQGATGLMTHCELVRVTPSNQKYELKQPPVHVLFDSTEGTLMAILVGHPGTAGAPRRALSGMRTAATSAVGTAALVAKRERVALGIFGSGEQARFHLIAFTAALDIAKVVVTSRTRANCDSFIADMRAMFPAISFEFAATAEELVASVDVVLTATNSNVPVFDGSLLRPGQHVTSIVGGNKELVTSGFLEKRRREIDDATILRADAIVVASIDQLRVDEQADIFDHAEQGLISWSKIQELGEVLVGKTHGRQNERDITLFKNNAGQGIADVAIGMAIYREALRLNIGIDVPAEAAAGLYDTAAATTAERRS